ncbi:MAG: hypothetical protein QNL62_13025 [Gammaproteobacteria bacterium]|nr:hypothetical protein [Gammaproteobacteria bacterium]
MNNLSAIKNSLIQQHTLLKGITEKLGLRMGISEQGWVVRDHQDHLLIMNSHQVPDEIGALEEKLRRIFF